jgi:glycosyltransferase involved in cell wall biosynthesis
MNSVTPVISVCIQTYQHKNYIRQCLDSVLSQKTNFPFEIILGEDDSTDGTREICIEYAAKYPNQIRLFLRSEKDKVYIHGRKTGRFNYIQNILAAEGKYIALLDGDDYWCDDLKLQTQFDFMEQNSDCALSFHKVECLKEGGYPDPFVYTDIHDKDTTFTIYDLLDEKIPTPVSAMFKKNCVSEFPDWLWQVPYIDYPLFFYCALRGKIGFISKIMGVYRIHPGGLWSSKNYESTLIAIWQQYNILCSQVGSDVQHLMLQRRHNIGLSLVHFYRTHSWENSDWFKQDLEKNMFPKDGDLLLKFKEPVDLKMKVQNSWNFGKHLVKKILKTA